MHALFVQDFEELKKLLIKRGIIVASQCHWLDPLYVHCLHAGDMYLQRVADSRQKIAHVANPFIRDGTVYTMQMVFVSVRIT